MLGELELDPANDFATFQWLGNTGSAALPVTMSIVRENGHVKQGENSGRRAAIRACPAGRFGALSRRNPEGACA